MASRCYVLQAWILGLAHGSACGPQSQGATSYNYGLPSSFIAMPGSHGLRMLQATSVGLPGCLIAVPRNLRREGVTCHRYNAKLDHSIAWQPWTQDVTWH